MPMAAMMMAPPMVACVRISLRPRPSATTPHMGEANIIVIAGRKDHARPKLYGSRGVAMPNSRT